MSNSRSQSSISALRLVLLALALGSFTDCGNIGPLTGGASEVGNPNAAIHASGENDTTARGVTGLEIDFRNATIHVKREARTNAAEPSESGADSAAFTRSENPTESRP